MPGLETKQLLTYLKSNLYQSHLLANPQGGVLSRLLHNSPPRQTLTSLISYTFHRETTADWCTLD